MTRRRPPACEWQRPEPHALTYARPYVNGWWCALHTPAAQQGRPESPPGPGWPAHRHPPHGTDPEAAAPTSTEHRQDETR